MKCNLIIEINELTVRDYTIIEDQGLIDIASESKGISFSYEEDEECPGKHVLVIKGNDLKAILKFLSFVEIHVKIIA
jgi:hypothetical protein